METIVLSGDIDPVGALRLRSRLRDAMNELRPIVSVDLTEVIFIYVVGVLVLIVVVC